MSQIIKAGIDIGSSSLKIALLDGEDSLLQRPIYVPHGKDLEKILGSIKQTLTPYKDEDLYVAMFGAFSGQVASSISAGRVTEIQAHIFGAPEEVKHIIDIGAGSCKFITKDGTSLISYNPNSKCASGTGSFIEEQSEAMLYNSLDDFFTDAESAESSAPIVARCAVFAKSGRVTASSRGFSKESIARGLVGCVAGNLNADVVKVENLDGLLTVHGRLGERKIVTDFIRQARNLPQESFVSAESPACQAAIGAARSISQNPEKYRFNPENLGKKSTKTIVPLDTPLKLMGKREEIYLDKKDQAKPPISSEKEYVVGIDIGSRSTVLGLVDFESGELSDTIYLNTQGKPLVATRNGIKHFQEKHGGSLKIKAVATTGSSRYAVGYFIGADVVEDEITAQAVGGLSFAKTLGLDLRGIVEIGGQDSKYLEIKDGIVLFSAMNQICSAGTGTFIEEQAARLLGSGLSNGERLDTFDRLALEADGAYTLHGRCTTFMKKECDYAAISGATQDQICAGVALGIARNYTNEFKQLERLTETLKLMPNPKEAIFFQGGTARNLSVLAAFQKLHDFDRFIVPPNCAETGALGIALYASEIIRQQEAQSGESYQTTFVGLDAELKYTQRSLTCRGCQNYCEISQVTTSAGKKIYDGHKCEEKFSNHETRKAAQTPIQKSMELLK